MRQPNQTYDPPNIGTEIQALYLETDIALPSPAHPIAPLGPVMARLPLIHIEMQELTTGRIFERMLQTGAVVSEEEFGEASEEPMAGFFYACGEYSWIYVRADDPIARRRFSAAHELGHYWLHYRPMLAGATEEEPAAWRDEFAEADADNPETVRRQSEQSKAEAYVRQEREANAFAAQLLMPAGVVLDLYECWRSRLYGKTNGGILDSKRSQNVSNQLAETFLVSRQAMTIRLESLGLPAGGTEAGED